VKKAQSMTAGSIYMTAHAASFKIGEVLPRSSCIYPTAACTSLSLTNPYKSSLTDRQPLMGANHQLSFGKNSLIAKVFCVVVNMRTRTRSPPSRAAL
jgi:hypothetical protein